MNKVLFVNKPKGITSFDLCYKLRKVFKTKAIGHTGTLDPNASGVMIILLNRCCKLNQFLVGDDKEYIAKVKLGFRTNTLDIDGEVIEERSCTMPSKDNLLAVLKSFVGKQKQLPPMTSAIKVNGKKLIDYQRQNQKVEVKPRDIEIYALELLSLADDEFIFKAHVSSGTYIRVLADDILNSLGIIGTLTDLTRISVGGVRIDDCDDLPSVLNNQFHEHEPYDLLASRYLNIDVSDDFSIKCGKTQIFDCEADEVFVSKGREALAIYRKGSDGKYHSVRGLF